MVKRKGMPQFGEFVLCTVTRVTQFAVWCKLDEYEQEPEGMIHISEVAGKWVYDIREFAKLGKQYVAKVIKLDPEAKKLNLSFKRVSKHDEKQKLNAFRREKRAEKILEQTARELGKTLEQAYKEIGFMLQENFGELFIAFEQAREEPDTLLKAGVSKEWNAILMKIIEKSFKEKEIKIKAELELKSFAEDGIEKIKQVLNDINKKNDVKIKYISAPKYKIEVVSKDPKNAEKKLRESLETAMQQIKKLDGEGSYKFIK